MSNPEHDETIAGEPTQPQPGTARTGPQAAQSSGQIDLNRASESEIAEIDFIGKKLARSIVEHRTATHGFRGWDDLKQVPGLDAMKISELQRAARLGEPRT
jgi:DNA uptake protein ComE-like DNA-binding protein